MLKSGNDLFLLVGMLTCRTPVSVSFFGIVSTKFI